MTWFLKAAVSLLTPTSPLCHWAEGSSSIPDPRILDQSIKQINVSVTCPHEDHRVIWAWPDMCPGWQQGEENMHVTCKTDSLSGLARVHTVVVVVVVVQYWQEGRWCMLIRFQSGGTFRICWIMLTEQRQQPHVHCNTIPVSLSLVTTVTRDELRTSHVRINQSFVTLICTRSGRNTQTQCASKSTRTCTLAPQVQNRFCNNKVISVCYW